MGKRKIDPSNLPLFLSAPELKEHVVTWSTDTLKKRIDEDGFPAIRDESGHYLFSTKDVLLWFKKREIRAG